MTLIHCIGFLFLGYVSPTITSGAQVFFSFYLHLFKLTVRVFPLLDYFIQFATINRAFTTLRVPLAQIRNNRRSITILLNYLTGWYTNKKKSFFCTIASHFFFFTYLHDSTKFWSTILLSAMKQPWRSGIGFFPVLLLTIIPVIWWWNIA